ncbi:MAG: LacI family DNA-binding transcriptional regulator [Candidatus Limnocylindrales bacterium]
MPKRLGQKPATLADVAAAVSLSPAAVSLALRGKDGVSEATRRRVVEAARALGYQPLAGASRQHQKPMTIGLVINPVHGGTQEANRFYAPVIAGIQGSCRSHHMDLMLATMPVDQHQYPIELPRIVTNRTCDGLIVVGAHLSQATAEILRTAPPAVLVDAYAEDDPFDSVVMDNVGGARTMVEHLVSRGHRDIAILATEPQAYPSILERRRGYGQALTEAGLSPHYIDALYWQPESAAVAALAYLNAHPDVSAVFCANDLVAVALLQAARQAAISVPGRLSVVGFDDIDLAGFVSPALTTMAVDKVGMGRIAVTLLAHRLEIGKECVTQTFVRPTLVERETVRTLEPVAPPGEAAPALHLDPQFA